MTDVKRERVAKMILATFRDVWCDRESDEEPFFNCSKCEFETYDGKCSVKVFLKSVKYEETYPDGMVEGGDDIDEDMAWMPLPTPYKGGDSE